MPRNVKRSDCADRSALGMIIIIPLYRVRLIRWRLYSRARTTHYLIERNYRTTTELVESSPRFYLIAFRILLIIRRAPRPEKAPEDAAACRPGDSCPETGWKGSRIGFRIENKKNVCHDCRKLSNVDQIMQGLIHLNISLNIFLGIILRLLWSKLKTWLILYLFTWKFTNCNIIIYPISYTFPLNKKSYKKVWIKFYYIASKVSFIRVFMNIL